MTNWTNEDILIVEKFIDISRRGYYCNSGELTDVYNRVLGKNVRNTNCGSCLRQRLNELEAALNAYKASIKAQETSPEPSKAEESIITPTEENKASEQPIMTEKRKAGRPKKK